MALPNNTDTATYTVFLSRGIPLRFFILTGAFLLTLLSPEVGKGAVAPVGQLPSVTVSVTPSTYALPILLVEELGEWKDFGILISPKVHASGKEQLDRVPANEWDVAVMEPFYAIKGGNDGDVAIVGLAGNFASQFHLVFRRGTLPSPPIPLMESLKGKKILCPIPSSESFWMNALADREGGNTRSLNFLGIKDEAGKAFSSGMGDLAILRTPRALTFAQEGYPVWSDPQKVFLPACLVATSNYADTRKTLVIRWMEGYSRGIRIIQKDPSRAASLLKAFYHDRLNLEVSKASLEKEIQQAFIFEEQKRDEALIGERGRPTRMESFARAMTDYQMQAKAIEAKKDPADFILGAVCDQLSKLRKEAEAQLQKTQSAIDQAKKDGTSVQEFQKKWDEASGQLQDGRGCLTVIGVLSDLQRSAEQTRLTGRRLNDFRKIELGIGLLLALYYAGYFVRRRKINSSGSRVTSPGSRIQ